MTPILTPEVFFFLQNFYKNKKKIFLLLTLIFLLNFEEKERKFNEEKRGQKSQEMTVGLTAKLM
jgi:hypothetical protein